MTNKLFKKFLSFSYGSWIGLILGLVTTMITTRLIAPADFGKASMYTLAINICMILTIFGTDQSFVRFFEEEQKKNRGALLYNCLKLPALTTVVLTIIILMFYESITFFLFGNSSLLIALVLVVGVVIQLLYRYAKLVIRMQQKGNLYSIIEILQRLISLFLLVGLLAIFGDSYRTIIYSTLITTLLLTIIAIYFERNFWNLRNIVRKDLFHSNTEIIKYGSPFVLTIFITWLFQIFDKIALRFWGSFEELGLYTAASNIVALLIVLQTTFSTFWTPVSYERFIKYPGNHDFFSNVTNIVSISMFFVAIITIAAKDIIVLLLGSEFEAASTIMPFLVFMPILYTLSETTVIGINFMKKTKWHILIAGISCLLNIIGNWILVPTYGALGASISTAASYVVFFSLRTHISLKLYKVNYKLKKIYFMIIIISAYASLSIVFTDYRITMLLGLIAILILILVYFSSIKGVLNKLLVK